MRNFLLVAALAATTLSAIPAVAQDYHDDRQDQRGDHRDDGRDHRDDHRDHRDDRHGGPQRNWQQYRSYDYNRYEPGQTTYYADRYYRDGSYYQPRRLGRNDRIYRGSDNRYYCRRSDGTTGLIIGGLAGGLLGNSLAGGGSRTLGTLLGGGAGAVLGRSIDRGQVQCR
jgi:Ni/Co efflux regulator RcnB